jgi:DNA-binding NarL/FixJ family response regulator
VEGLRGGYRTVYGEDPVSIRVMIVDDHPIVLGGLQQLFQRQPDVVVSAACSGADAALAAMKTGAPDVLVLDLRMPGMTGLQFLQRLSDEGLRCRTVLLTAAIDDAEVVEAVRLGVSGLVMKDSAPDTLVECVRKVHAGGQWLDHATVTRAFRTQLDREAAVRDTALTPREIEIVRMVAEGLRNRVIAARLSISEGTVKVHLHNIYEKLGVDGRLELTLCAQQKGLL